jgi:hypothetical protein
VGIEYHSNPIGSFERMRQPEAEADQIITHFSPLSYLPVPDRYPDFLRTMMLESLPCQRDANAQEDVDTIASILNLRRKDARKRQLSIVNLISIPDIRQFLLLGLIGRFNTSEPETFLRRVAAQAEINHLASFMMREPMGSVSSINPIWFFDAQSKPILPSAPSGQENCQTFDLEWRSQPLIEPRSPSHPLA